MLHVAALDLSEAVKYLKKTEEFLRGFHSDKGFLEVKPSDAKQLAEEIDLEDAKRARETDSGEGNCGEDCAELDFCICATGW